MSGGLDQLAEALGRARTAHEKRPDDKLLELRFEEARANYLDGQLKAKDEELRAAVSARTAALGEVAKLRAEMTALRSSIADRIRAVIDRRADGMKAKRRKGGVRAAPLLEAVS